jgi:hypothetical protein
MKMTLRDHPLLTDQGVHSWPPIWVWTGGEEKTTAAGEVGVLRDVKAHDAISSKCFLFIEHNGATFIGRLSFESWALCQEVVKFLKQHRGEPLKSIAELGADLTDTQLSICHTA